MLRLPRRWNQRNASCHRKVVYDVAHQVPFIFSPSLLELRRVSAESHVRVSPRHTRTVRHSRRRSVPPKPVSNTARPPAPDRRLPRKAVPHLVHDAFEAEHFRPVQIKRIGLPVQATCASGRAAGESDCCGVEHVGAGTAGAGVAGQSRGECISGWAAGTGLAEECVV